LKTLERESSNCKLFEDNLGNIVEKLPQGGVWIPAENPQSPWLLIALHGSRGSSEDFNGLDEVLNTPDLNYLYVNGPIPFYSSYMWYDNTAARHAAYGVLDQVFQDCQLAGYPPEKTFLLGFSQGAALTFEFGVRHRDLLAGYIAISGRVEELSSLTNEGDPSIIRRARWLVTHGTEDYNLSIDIIRQQVEQMRSMGFKIDYNEYNKIHEMEAEDELRDVSEWVRSRMD
jgi:phospholipase/carboxylesterase